MRKQSGVLVYSPTDLVRFFASPFASWMDRCHLEKLGALVPDEETEDQRLIAETGDEHERAVLQEFRGTAPGLVEIERADTAIAEAQTLAAIRANASVVFQAALKAGPFAGFADFLILDETGRHQVWDTKLALTPKPYYAIQLCCYSEMLAEATGGELPEKFGIILGDGQRSEFRIEDFLHYYRRIKARFLAMEEAFTGSFADRPEPMPRADHGRWASHAENFFAEADHLVQVAGISVGQIKKLKDAGIATMAALSGASGKPVGKLASESLERLAAQARLQCQTREDRKGRPDAEPHFELLPGHDSNGKAVGLAALPPANSADVFFDMEGYPLVAGGLEYLFGACFHHLETGQLEFKDWWAHDRDEEKVAFEGFVDWAFELWRNSPGMHIYHYATYEVTALRRLSTRHDTRQEEVDELLRQEVFVDLYKIVRRSLRIGEDSYSIKRVERLYRPKRSTEVATAADSIVQYARWMESGQGRAWNTSAILSGIRDYNEDDCRSTTELVAWLRLLAAKYGIPELVPASAAIPEVRQPLPAEVIERQKTIAALREKGDPVALVLADLIEFHRREQKPVWWRMFDLAQAEPDALRDDPGCIQGISAVGTPESEKQSLVQRYRFDPAQECKLDTDDKVMFAHQLEAKFTLAELDAGAGDLRLKIGRKTIDGKFGGAFPAHGSLIPDEVVPPAGIPNALAEVAAGHLSQKLHAPASALLTRSAPAKTLQQEIESPLDAAIRIGNSISGGCLVVQGPPGPGKTFTASQVIAGLLAKGKRVGVSSNSHSAVMNLLAACGAFTRKQGVRFSGIKVGGKSHGALFADNPGVRHIGQTTDAFSAYQGGIVGGTAWLFTRPEWVGALDVLFIDEAGQVPLANAVAMSRCAANLVLLGDQMQLEQPVQGAHPGDAGLSVLQYVLMDAQASEPDAPVFHAVVPATLGIFLGESRRMHPEVCRFISDSIYEGRLTSHLDCARQRIGLPPDGGTLVTKESGIVFSEVQHEGNIQRSDKEVSRVKAIYQEMLGRDYTAADGRSRSLTLDDFLFIAPYNAQVRALQSILPAGARVGSVDKLQGQEAPACILSLCSSFGEYGSRGLGFILDRNRINVAISRAQCLAVVVADPRIAHSPAASIDEMMLLNLFSKLAA